MSKAGGESGTEASRGTRPRGDVGLEYPPSGEGGAYTRPGLGYPKLGGESGELYFPKSNSF